MKKRKPECYWAYTKADAMVGHRYTDDVALCRASTKTEAIKKFSKYYSDACPENVSRIFFHQGQEVVILTDY